MSDGGLLLKVHYVSIDPYQRGRMRDPAIKSYFRSFTLGQPIDNRGICTVVESRNSTFKKGDLVSAFVHFADYMLCENEAKVKEIAVQKLPTKFNIKPMSHFIGGLGMPGRLVVYSLTTRIYCLYWTV
jgi:NADPH-dependent curcumin reductase CurA